MLARLVAGERAPHLLCCVKVLRSSGNVPSWGDMKSHLNCVFNSRYVVATDVLMHCCMSIVACHVTLHAGTLPALQKSVSHLQVSFLAIYGIHI